MKKIATHTEICHFLMWHVSKNYCCPKKVVREVWKSCKRSYTKLAGKLKWGSYKGAYCLWKIKAQHDIRAEWKCKNEVLGAFLLINWLPYASCERLAFSTWNRRLEVVIVHCNFRAFWCCWSQEIWGQKWYQYYCQKTRSWEPSWWLIKFIRDIAFLRS